MICISTGAAHVDDVQLSLSIISLTTVHTYIMTQAVSIVYAENMIQAVSKQKTDLEIL